MVTEKRARTLAKAHILQRFFEVEAENDAKGTTEIKQYTVLIDRDTGEVEEMEGDGDSQNWQVIDPDGYHFVFEVSSSGGRCFVHPFGNLKLIPDFAPQTF